MLFRASGLAPPQRTVGHALRPRWHGEGSLHRAYQSSCAALSLCARSVGCARSRARRHCAGAGCSRTVFAALPLSTFVRAVERCSRGCRHRSCEMRLRCRACCSCCSGSACAYAVLRACRRNAAPMPLRAWGATKRKHCVLSCRARKPGMPTTRLRTCVQLAMEAIPEPQPKIRRTRVFGSRCWRSRLLARAVTPTPLNAANATGPCCAARRGLYRRPELQRRRSPM